MSEVKAYLESLDMSVLPANVADKISMIIKDDAVYDYPDGGEEFTQFKSMLESKYPNAVPGLAAKDGAEPTMEQIREFMDTLQILADSGNTDAGELLDSLKIVYGEEMAKGGGVGYKDAINEFNKELLEHPMVKKASEYYGKTTDEIVKTLQPRLSTKGNRQGNTTDVYIDFTDTNSGIKIKHKKEYANGGNVSGNIVRKMYSGDAVLYKDEVWYVTEKDGKLGITNLKSGSWGTDYPFIELSKVDMGELTDMMGRNVEISRSEMAHGGGVRNSIFLYEGQSLLLNSVPSPKEEKFLNTEIVVEKIKDNKIVEAFVRKTGEKVPFIIDPYKFKMEQYAKGGGVESKHKKGVVLVKSAKASNHNEVWDILNEKWKRYKIVNSRAFDLETPYNRGWIDEGISINVFLLKDTETNKYYWDSDYIEAKKNKMANGGAMGDFYAVTKFHTGETKLVPVKKVSFHHNGKFEHEPTMRNLESFFSQVPFDEMVCIYDNERESDGELHSAHTPLFTSGAKKVHGIVDESGKAVKFESFDFYARGGRVGKKGTKSAFGLLDFEALESIFNTTLFGLDEDETEETLDELRAEWNALSEKERIEILNEYVGSEWKEQYAKGGKLSKYRYVPNRNVESVELTKGKKTIDVDGAHVLDGVYVRKDKYAKGGAIDGLYEVVIKERTGARTLADFSSKKEAESFVYQYSLKHPLSKLSIEKKYAKGGAIENIKEEIRSVNVRLKALEEINTEEAYRQSEILRKQKASLEALLLHYPDEPKLEKRSSGRIYHALGGGVGLGTNYNVVYEKPNSDIAYTETINANSLEEARDKFYAKHPTCTILHLSEEYAKGGAMAEGESYEYVNTFGIDDTDFQRMVDAYHNAELPDTSLTDKYGEETVSRASAYIHATHQSNIKK